MKVSPVTTYQQNYKYKPNFTSCAKIYNPKTITNLDIFAKDKVRTTSGLFRPDRNWEDVMRYIFWNFLNEEKVNIVSLGCSDSSEPLSYALYLYSKTPKSYYKKFYISGADIDPEMIKIAKSGEINLSADDFERMKKYIKNPELYFKKLGDPIKITNNITNDEKSYKIDPELHSMMEFKKSDILTEVKGINLNENYVLNINNVFPYLKDNYSKEVLKTISQRLKTGSLFMFGKYDHLEPNFKQKLFNLGFFSPIPEANFVQKL